MPLSQEDWIGTCTYCKCILWNNNTRIAEHDILAGNILAHRSSHEVEPDAVLHSQVQRRKFRLPYLDRERLQDISRGLAFRGSVFGNGSVDLGLNLGVPDRIVSEIAEDPRCLNGGIDQAGK